MSSKQVREIDGYKFYSIAHDSKEKAQEKCLVGFYPSYDKETKAWYNISRFHANQMQEDFGVSPCGKEFK